MTTIRIMLGAIQLWLVFTLLGCARGPEDAEAAAARTIVRTGGYVSPSGIASASERRRFVRGRQNTWK